MKIYNTYKTILYLTSLFFFLTVGLYLILVIKRCENINIHYRFYQIIVCFLTSLLLLRSA